MPRYSEQTHLHTFSILVPVRNEERTIGTLLDQLARLDYPAHLYEVIVIDDASEDDTAKVVRDRGIRLLTLPEGKKGKKAALALGVGQATHDIVLTTDGDCEVQSQWLRAFNQCFDSQTQLTVGPVRMQASSFLGALQSFDFSVLIGYAAALVGMGIPSMSNGANLAYRREVFDAVGGYNSNDRIPSGDDEFLLLKVVNKYPEGIRFCNEPSAVVITSAKGSFRELLNQRVRWLSKWTLHKNWKIIFSVLLILFDNLAMIAGLVGILSGSWSAWLLAVWLCRWAVKLAFSWRVNRLLGGQTHPLAALVYEFLYPFYVLLLTFASIFGHYTWKGRTYR